MKGMLIMNKEGLDFLKELLDQGNYVAANKLLECFEIMSEPIQVSVQKLLATK
jgi:hypothetical protein